MRILGISCYYHDSAAALVQDGAVQAAAQEERFTRRKHDARFPGQAIRYCLEEASTSLSQLDAVVFYEKPFLKFERLLETYLSFAPRGVASFAVALPIWIREKLFQRKLLNQGLALVDPAFDPSRLLFAEHHLSHSASAFFPSPFSEALVLTLDGVGEWATTSAALGSGNQLKIFKEIHFPHSLGLLYSAFTYYCGFRVNSGEYKLMGLAPYGQPRYAGLIRDHLISVYSDGSFRLNLEYFNYCTGLTMTNRRFARLFGSPARRPSEPLQQFHMDVAASIQLVLEEMVLALAASLKRETGARRLCLAGGVALNCVANGKLQRAGLFDEIWIQPAAGDAGGAIGAALAGYHLFQDQPRHPLPGDSMRGSFLGPQFSQPEIERRLAAAGARFSVLADDDLLDVSCRSLVEGEALGWFQGRMEFGPRALGGRSILADPRSAEMQSTLNQRVKFRESFRPFAPSVLREDLSGWFELDQDSPYMLLVAGIRESRRRAMTLAEQLLFGVDKLKVPRSEIPAVTHVDYSARIQTVHAATNPRYHALLRRFKERTGCPVLVNTSFNVRGEPIVGTPEDAFHCFMGTGIESLAVGNCFLHKQDQDFALQRNYEGRFELD